jgi:glutaredoxin 3
MPDIKVYGTPSCPYCKMAKSYLADLQVPFEDVDVSANQLAAQEMISKSGQLGVPVIDIDGNIVVGFNRQKIAGLLKQSS